MRIATKINLALAAVIGLGVVVNLVVLTQTVRPLFGVLQAEAAATDHNRVLDAIEQVGLQMRSSAGDWAFWDDTYVFLATGAGDYVARNLGRQSLGELDANYFTLIDHAGEVVLDVGVSATGSLVPGLATGNRRTVRAMLAALPGGLSHHGLVTTDLGLVAVGYGPVLRSDRSGPPLGILAFGKLLEAAEIGATTHVALQLLSDGRDLLADGRPTVTDGALSTVVSKLPLLDGSYGAVLRTATPRSISAAGDRAIATAIGLIALVGVLVLLTLHVLVQRIAVRRIEAMRHHLVNLTAAGELRPMACAGTGDELGDVAESFNAMSAHLDDLRARAREVDYLQGAADRNADILHNVRNALSPVGTLVWSLRAALDAGWKQGLPRALSELGDLPATGERAHKLQTFAHLAAGRLHEEREQTSKNLQLLESRCQDIERILAEPRPGERRPPPPLDLAPILLAAVDAARLRFGGKLALSTPRTLPPVLVERSVISQVLDNLLANAIEATEARGRNAGRIDVWVEQLGGTHPSAIEIGIVDNGCGLSAETQEHVFERGFSIRRPQSGGLGLHYCANALADVGGSIGVESAGPDTGATIRLRLPCAEADERAFA